MNLTLTVMISSASGARDMSGVRPALTYNGDTRTTIAVPGDPAIDSNFDKPDAPIATHEGMTWVHTTGRWLYDTSSGDLEIGDYALQPSGTYIQNAPPFVSSTSTPAKIDASTPDASTSSTDNGTSTPAQFTVPISDSGHPVDREFQYGRASPPVI
jgi:hypothetical protein